MFQQIKSLQETVEMLLREVEDIAVQRFNREVFGKVELVSDRRKLVVAKADGFIYVTGFKNRKEGWCELKTFEFLDTAEWTLSSMLYDDPTLIGKLNEVEELMKLTTFALAFVSKKQNLLYA